MISAVLLPPPAPSHGTRSPAASLARFFFLSLLGISRQRSRPAPPHTGEAAWQPTAAAAAPLHRGMAPSLLMSLSVTVCLRPAKQSSLVLSPCLLFFFFFFFFCCSGWRLEGVYVCGCVCVCACVCGILTSLLDNHIEGKTPALRFRSQALPLAPCVSWPLASPPLPPSLSLLPSLSFHLPSPSCCSQTQSE